MNVRSRIGWRGALVILLIILAAAVLIYFMQTGRIGGLIGRWINKDTHAVTFVLLFLTLPLIGFPISVFLLLLGAKFDTGPALLIMFAGMAFHQVLTYPAANTVLRPFIEKQLAKRNCRLPRFPEIGFVWPSIIFMAVPGLSYTMKNYMLSLSSVPFRYFFLVAWLVQAVMGIPMVIAGDVLGGRYTGLMIILLVFLALGYGIRLWIKRHLPSGSADCPP